MQSHEKRPFLVWCVLIISAVLVFFVVSKEKKSAGFREEITKIVENKEVSDLLDDLYLASGGDVESIARILNVTPSSVERVRKGVSYPSSEFGDRIKEVYSYYCKADKDFYRLRADLDPSWTVFHSIGFSRQTHPSLFWSIIIIISIFYLYFNFKHEFQRWKPTSILLAAVILLYAVAAIYAKSFPRPMDDGFETTINPAVELIAK